MSSPKTVKRYNAMWFELFDRFLDDEYATIEVPCKSEPSAKSFRLEFYKVRNALCGDGSRPPEDGELSRMYEGVLNSREVKVRGNVCVFSHRDRNWVGEALMQALAPSGEGR